MYVAMHMCENGNKYNRHIHSNNTINTYVVIELIPIAYIAYVLVKQTSPRQNVRTLQRALTPPAKTP